MRKVNIAGIDYDVHEEVYNEIIRLREQQCDVYNMNGLPCDHMDELIKALEKKHFEIEMRDLFKEEK